jgi:hypothetical protein
MVLMGGFCMVLETPQDVSTIYNFHGTCFLISLERRSGPMGPNLKSPLLGFPIAQLSLSHHYLFANMKTECATAPLHRQLCALARTWLYRFELLTEGPVCCVRFSFIVSSTSKVSVDFM